jgi:hypothetical protein
MSCDLTKGRLFACKDAIGGVKEILWAVWNDVTLSAIVAGEVSDISSDFTFYRWQISRNSGTFDQDVQSNMENGTVYYEQNLSFNLPKIEADITDEMRLAWQNRLLILVRDNNDNWHVMGYGGGAEVNGGGVKTGTAVGDMNGYENVWMAEERIPAPLLDFDPTNTDPITGEIQGITGTVVVSPNY